MTSQSRSKRSARMLSAKLASPLNAVAKPSSAVGRHVVDDLQHRGALVAGAGLGRPARRRPAAHRRPATRPSESTPSDSAQIFTPTPVTPTCSREVSALCVRSPSLSIAPARSSSAARVLARDASGLGLLGLGLGGRGVAVEFAGGHGTAGHLDALDVLARGDRVECRQRQVGPDRAVPGGHRLERGARRWSAPSARSLETVARMSTTVLLPVTRTPLCSFGTARVIAVRLARAFVSTSSLLSTLDSIGAGADLDVLERADLAGRVLQGGRCLLVLGWWRRGRRARQPHDGEQACRCWSTDRDLRDACAGLRTERPPRIWAVPRHTDSPYRVPPVALNLWFGGFPTQRPFGSTSPRARYQLPPVSELQHESV